VGGTFAFCYAEKELKEEAVHVADKVILSTLSRAVCFVVMSIYSVHAPVSLVAINLSHFFAFVARSGTIHRRSRLHSVEPQIIVDHLQLVRIWQEAAS
jgi:hypothetical protein